MVDLGQAVAGRDTLIPGCDTSDTADPRLSHGRMIRAAREDDLADVTALVRRLARRRHPGLRPQGFDAMLRDRLFGPDRAPGAPAGLVATDARGVLQGFVAPAMQPMRLGSRSLRGLTAFVPMVDPGVQDPTARVRMLRAVFDLPYDLAVTEMADPAARLLIEQFGGHFLPLHSMDWLLPRHGLALRYRLDRMRLTALDRALGLAVRVRSAWARTATADPAARARSRLSFTTPSWPDLGADVAALTGAADLRPDWGAAPGTLDNRLAEAAALQRHGPLYARAAFGTGGEPVAAWLAHLRPGGVGRVLQILAHPGLVDDVLDDCLAAADAIGSVALRGRLQPDLLPALARRNTTFAPRLATMVHARHPAVLEEALRAPAMLTGLAGESWSCLAEAVAG